MAIMTVEGDACHWCRPVLVTPTVRMGSASSATRGDEVRNTSKIRCRDRAASFDTTAKNPLRFNAHLEVV